VKTVSFKLKTDREKFRFGILVSDDKVLDATSLISEDGLDAHRFNQCFDLEKGLPERAAEAAENGELPEFSIREVNFCAPVPAPGKVICIGLNYRNHAEESGMEIPKSPIIFSKFSSCVVGPDEAIRIPPASAQVDYEAELAVVLGKRASRVSAADALDHVFGYTNFNDVSARDFQFADGQWQRGKSCDTFAPMGPFIASRDEIQDPHSLAIRFRLNGETLQDSNTRELIFGIPELIEFLSDSITLEPGDVIATGTPPGVGFARKPPVFLKPGDVAEVEIEGLGVLRNEVEA